MANNSTGGNNNNNKNKNHQNMINVIATSTTKATWLGLGIRSNFQSLIVIIVTLIIVFGLYLIHKNNGSDHQNQMVIEDAHESTTSSSTSFLTITTTTTTTALVGNATTTAAGIASVSGGDHTEDAQRCDWFSGQWVFDDKSYPLYKDKECSFMSDQLACEKFGRKDLSYQHWRWQPHHCDLPRFNGRALLERLRNKRLVYIGDSLNRNQWVSMICLLDTSVPHIRPNSIRYRHNNSLIVFKADDYNATVEFYWAPLLVESNSDDPVKHRIPDRIVRVQSIEKHAKHWTNADFLVFNSYLWWRRPRMKALWGSFEKSGEGIYKEVMMPRVYEMALETWSKWLEMHVNGNKTRVFFMSPSPTHESADEWGGWKNKTCYMETEPIQEQGYQGRTTNPAMLRVVENVISELNTKRGLNLQLLNITQLTEYRKDGHPSIFRKQWEPLQQQQLTHPNTYADCIHWCLPGVPDVWNLLLHAFILHSPP